MTTKIKKRFNDNGYIFYADPEDVKYCDHCGKIVLSGMTTDDGDIHVHEECFNDYMDNTYGKGKWKETEYDEELDETEQDEYGGYYLYTDNGIDWYGTGIYYTEWWDDYDGEWEYINGKAIRTFYAERKELSHITVYIGTDDKGNDLYKCFYNPTEEEIKWTIND